LRASATSHGGASASVPRILLMSPTGNGKTRLGKHPAVQARLERRAGHQRRAQSHIKDEFIRGAADSVLCSGGLGLVRRDDVVCIRACADGHRDVGS
jgi:hypothetical protein